MFSDKHFPLNVCHSHKSRSRSSEVTIDATPSLDPLPNIGLKSICDEPTLT